MGSAAPIEGRCGAKLRKKAQFCAQYPLKGALRCRQHGGGAQIFSVTGADVDHPSRHRRLKKLMDDPDLLNVKRPVALARVVVDMVDVEQLVQRVHLQQLRSAGGEAVDAAEIATLLRLLERYGKLVDLLGKRQEAAIRVQRTSELLVSAILPLVEKFSRRYKLLADKYVPPERQGEFAEEMQQVAALLVAEVARAGNESR